MLKLFLSSDHVTAATGKTVAITISKNGGAFGNPNAGATNATEVSSGWYKVTMDATDTGTEGDLVVRGTAASCDDTERVFRVHLPANFGVTSIDSNGRVDVIKIAGTTQTAGDVGIKTGFSLAATGLDAVTESATGAKALADALLNRDMSVGTDSGSPTVRTVRQALRFLRNKWSISGTALTVTKEDDTTSSWTGTVTASPGADPISGNDPA